MNTTGAVTRSMSGTEQTRPRVKRNRPSFDPKEHWFKGPRNRILQMLARSMPGAMTLRVMLHRARGVRIGQRVWIGYDVVLETSCPDLITIEDGASISIRATVIAHFKEFRGVRIGRDAFIGPGAMILPNVVIGEGAVIKAGSVVSQSVPPWTIVEGNPAVAVARCEVPMALDTSMKEFAKGVRPLKSRQSNSGPEAASGRDKDQRR